jgi:serine/threonine protein kinase
VDKASPPLSLVPLPEGETTSRTDQAQADAARADEARAEDAAADQTGERAPKVTPSPSAPLEAPAPQGPPGSVTIRSPASSRAGGKAAFDPKKTALWLPSMASLEAAGTVSVGGPAVPQGGTPPDGSPLVGAVVSALGAAAERQQTVIVISGGSNATTRMAANTTHVEVVGSAAPDPAVPRPFRVGPYEVATRLARGGMGSVYVCRKAGGDGRLLTLKVVREHALQQDLAAASFRHEALVGSYVRHPNAHTVIDTGLYEGQPYLILDYLDGGCLVDLLAGENRPPPAVVVAIILDVLTALQSIHRANDEKGKPLGLIHCDVSPGNILVGVNGLSRLADFGSARITALANEAQPFAVSKPLWMPPEQFRGEKLDSRSDIYSAGIVLYTALSGQQPFEGDSYDAIAMNVMRKKLRPPSAFGAPASLDDVCMQAINRFPDGRFVVADAMAAALRTAAQKEHLIESREGVGRWVRAAMGDDLAQRHRLIGAMFSGSALPRGEAAARAAARASGAAAASKMMPTPAHGGKTLSARTLFTPAPDKDDQSQLQPQPQSDEVPRAKLTKGQQAIIAVASALAFALTVAIGLAVMPRDPVRAPDRRQAELAPGATAPASRP